jgi:hypothetical protein
MHTKLASFVIALAVVATACTNSKQYSMVQQVPDGRIPTLNSTPTPTAEPSSTNTPTEVPPTETPTPRPPTATATPSRTPTPRISIAKVIADSNVIIRSGPCYQTPIAQAKPGMEFPVTGWYRSPQGEEWLRIEFRENNSIREGWVRADLVEVTNSDLVERVFANCPLTETPIAPKTNDSFIRLYKKGAFRGDFLDIKVTDCGVVNINSAHNLKFHDSIYSFELFAPTNVEVVLAEHLSFDERFPGKIGRWRGNNDRLQVDIAELRALGLQDEISSVIWLIDGQLSERTYCQR